MTFFTFPRLVATGVAASLVAGAAHQAFATLASRRHHEGFEPHTVRCESGNIITYYLRRGEPGAPVLVCEAGLISTSLIFMLLADHLPNSVPILVYDRAGYRRSLRRCPEDYCLQESVNDLVDVIRAGIGAETPCVLTGHSLGAYLAYRAATALPEQARGLALIDPAHPRELVNSWRQRQGARGVNLTMKLAPLSVLLGAGLLMDKKNILESLEGSPYYWPLRYESSSYAVWRAALREWNYSYPFMLDGGQPLDPVSIPVTVLAAEKTLATTPEHKDLYTEYVAAGKGGQLITIEGSNHQSIIAGIDCVAQTAEAVMAVLAAAANSGRDQGEEEA